MRVLATILFVLFSDPMFAQPPTCAGTKEECQQKEIIELQQALAQAQIALVQRDLRAAWAKLEADVRARLKATPEDEIDLATLTIKPKSK